MKSLVERYKKHCITASAMYMSTSTQVKGNNFNILLNKLTDDFDTSSSVDWWLPRIWNKFVIEWWIFEWYSFVPNNVSNDEIVIRRDSFKYSFVQTIKYLFN